MVRLHVRLGAFGRYDHAVTLATSRQYSVRLYVRVSAFDRKHHAVTEVVIRK